MWKISYTWIACKSLCYFDSYDEAKKAYDHLKDRYIDKGNIALRKVVTTTYNEWLDQTKGKIQEYESY